MRSWGESQHSYDPELWELDYQSRRYLSRVSEADLVVRYTDIARNMLSLVSDERDAIPIISFLSSWYWFRKEHQTRLEFHLRNIPLAQPYPNLRQPPLYQPPARPRSPNAGDVLFRYASKKRLDEFMVAGKVRITSAREYALLEKDLARRDDERQKHSYIPGDYAKVTLQDGTELRMIGDIKQTVSGVDYFVYCLSCDWDRQLFDDFGVDCCAIIKSPDIFADRLSAAAKSQLNGWYFHHCPIQYFDPYEMGRNQRIDNAMSKDFRFAYQREYRFLWASFQGLSATGFKELELGPLHDIAQLSAKLT